MQREILPLLGLLILFAAPILSTAQAMMPGNGSCLMYGGGWGGGLMAIFASLFWILLLALMVLGCIWLAKQIRRI